MFSANIDRQQANVFSEPGFVCTGGSGDIHWVAETMLLSCWLMRILIDATPLLLRSAGVKNYTYYWIQSLSQLARNERIMTFPSFGRFGPLTHEHSVLGTARTTFHLGTVFASNTMPWLPLLRWSMPRADVFHVSNQIRFPPNGGKLTATIYDMTVRLMPELHTADNIRAEDSLANNVLRRAAGLIAISENSKQDAVRLLGLDGDRVEVIYPGVPEVYFGAQPRPTDRPYVLYLGTIEPRKNVDTLLDAWSGFRLRGDFDLVIAGASGWAAERTLARLKSRLPGVRYLGYVPEDELPGLVAGATAFVYPSLYEGFGFPVAQAMAAGVPVITSNTSCLPEIAGEAALLIDPRSEGEIRSALEKLLSSLELQRELAAAGIARAQREFRWEICARKSLAFFGKV